MRLIWYSFNQCQLSTHTVHNLNGLRSTLNRLVVIMKKIVEFISDYFVALLLVGVLVYSFIVFFN